MEMENYRELKAPFFTAVFVFLGLFLYTRLAGPIPFFVNSVQTTNSSLFKAEGSGEAAGVPKTAQFFAGITGTAQTPEDAQEQANKTTNNITVELKKIGVKEKDIKTSDYRINPQYRFPETGESQQITGYTVTQTLEVKVNNIDLANKAVDASVKNGANLLSGVSFVLSDEDLRELEDEARKEAIDEARDKAERIASLSGIKLGKVINIEENTGGGVIPLRAQGGSVEKDDTATKLNPGEAKVQISVTLFYETR